MILAAAMIGVVGPWSVGVGPTASSARSAAPRRCEITGRGLDRCAARWHQVSATAAVETTFGILNSSQRRTYHAIGRKGFSRGFLGVPLSRYYA